MLACLMLKINCPAATCSCPGSGRGWMQGQEKHWHEKLCEIQPEGGMGESRLTRGRRMHCRSLDVRGQLLRRKTRKAEEEEDPLNGEQTANWVANQRTWRRGWGKGRVGNCRQNHVGEGDLGAACCPGLPQRVGKRPGGRWRNRAGRGG